MNKKLSVRDKKLIILLLVVTIIAGYLNFVLFPLMNKKNELEGVLSNLASLKQSMSSAILVMEEKKSTYEENLKLYNEKKSLLKFMNNEEIDTLISNLCQQCSLIQTDFSVSTKDYQKLNENEKIVAAEIKLQLTGESSGIFMFIDSIDKIKNLFVDSFSIADLALSKNYSIVLSLYMISEK